MLTQFRFELKTAAPVQPEWAYQMYAALLSEVPAEFAEQVHQDQVTPVSQFLERRDGQLCWCVSLLGTCAENAFTGPLSRLEHIDLRQHHCTLQVAGRRVTTIPDVDTLCRMAAADPDLRRLEFCTPAAFKSHGTYVYLPTVQLMLQSLVKKWNGCIPDCPIEDEDGEGVNALAAGLRIRDYQLHAQGYHLKGNRIPGFQGSMLLENRLEGFQHTLADMLLSFAAYSGIGIKTTLGMGGIRSTPVPSTERK